MTESTPLKDDFDLDVKVLTRDLPAPVKAGPNDTEKCTVRYGYFTCTCYSSCNTCRITNDFCPSTYGRCY
jgi:hypothetical protein